MAKKTKVKTPPTLSPSLKRELASEAKRAWLIWITDACCRVARGSGDANVYYAKCFELLRTEAKGQIQSYTSCMIAEIVDGEAEAEAAWKKKCRERTTQHRT